MEIRSGDGGYRYWAFISYSHADEAWAKWLHSALETYRVPRRLVGSAGPFGPRPRRLFPVFRDRDELSSAAELSSVIEAALRESRYLIVICSPNSAKSQWVDAEIRRYKALGREPQVLALIVDGEPHAKDAALECFPLALRRQVDRRGEITDTPSEPIAADARPFADHKHGARLKLIAGMLGIGYDELFQRERQRRFWLRVQQGVAALAGVALLAGLSAWFQEREAHLIEEARLDRLIQIGRQELRDDHHARAAVYFAEVLRGGRDSTALRYWLARAMQPVDAVEPHALDLGMELIRAKLSADDQHLLAIDTQTVQWLDLESGQVLHRYAVPQTQFFSGGLVAMSTLRAVVSGVGDTGQGHADALTSILDLKNGGVVATVPGLLWNGTGLRISPDGRRLLVGVQSVSSNAADTYVAVYDLLDGRKLAELRRADGVISPSFSADGRQIVTGGEGSGPIRIWDATHYRLLRTLQPRQRVAHSAYWSGRGEEILSINEAGAVKLWDGGSGELLDALGSHSLFGLAVDHALSRYWLTTSIDGTRVWDLERGQSVFETSRFGGYSADVALHPRGLHILTPADQSGPALWNVRERRLDHSLEVHADAAAETSFESSGERILVASRRGKLRWLRLSGLSRPLVRLEHDTYIDPTTNPGVGVLTVDADGRNWITGGSDGTLRRWDSRSGAALSRIDAHPSTVVDVLPAAGELLISRDSRGGLRGWRPQATAALWALDAAPETTVRDLGAHGDSPHFAVLGAGSEVRIHDAASGALSATFDIGGTPSSLLLLAGGRQLLVNHEDRPPEVWDLDARARIFVLGSEGVGATALALNRSGDRCAIGEAGGGLSLWDLRSGERLAQHTGGGKDLALFVSELTFSADGQTVAVGTFSGPILLWRPDSGEAHSLLGHQQGVRRLAFDPLGQLLASGSDNGELMIWDIASGQMLDRLGSTEESITGIAFDRSSTRLASSVRLNDAVRLWDVGLETRDLVAIDHQLDCAVPWQLDGLKVVRRTPNPAACVKPTARAPEAVIRTANAAP